MYYSTRLFTETTRPGWNVLSVTGASGTKLVTAFGDGAGALTVLGLDTSGAALDTASPTSVPYAIAGLPANAHLQLVVWNADGSGTVAPAAPVVTDAGGTATFAVPLQAVFALTSVPV